MTEQSSPNSNNRKIICSLSVNTSLISQFLCIFYVFSHFYVTMLFSAADNNNRSRFFIRIFDFLSTVLDMAFTIFDHCLCLSVVSSLFYGLYFISLDLLK